MNAFSRPPAGRSDKGFTMVELLVVILIVGILSAIAIPAFIKQRDKAVQASLESDLRTVAHQLTETYADLNAYFVVTGAEGNATVGSPNPAVVRTSPGNRIDGVLIGTTGYCLTGHNDRASADLYYSSAAGQTDAPC